MSSVSRRDMMKTLVASGIGLSTTALANTESSQVKPQAAFSSASDSIRALKGQHQATPLPFDATKLKGISEKLIRSHWENNYTGAVKALNVVEQRLEILLKDKDIPAFIYGDLKREELVRTGSIVLHDLYFGNLGGDGKPGEDILDVMKQWFGGYEQWENEFKKVAISLAGTSGWAIFAYNLYTGEFHNYWAWDHMHNAPMSYPILVLDMYEHAYHMDYGASANKYFDVFMQNVNWKEVARRASMAVKIKTK